MNRVNRVLEPDEAIRLSGYRATAPFDDGGYSALHRPGSWEWQLEGAIAARDQLLLLGYECRRDPEVDWRVVWVGTGGGS